MWNSEMMSTAERLKLPRATAEQVQAVVNGWRAKHATGNKDTDRGAFREWCYMTCQHWFQPAGPFKPSSWSQEDIAAAGAALKSAELTRQPLSAQ